MPGPSTTPRRLAIAAMVAVVIGGVGLAIVSFPQPSVPGAATPSDATAEATFRSPAANLPTEVAGLNVISVSDAIAVRNAGVDGRELAVRGWLTRGTGPQSCQGEPEPRSLALSECDRLVWLTERPQTMRLSAGETGLTDGGPEGPAFTPYLDEVDTSWLSPIPDRGGSTPQDVVLIGHFDDRRSRQCPADAESGCRGRFVVDRVCWVDGTEIELSNLNELGGPTASIDHDVATLVLEFVPQASILSALTVPGERLAEIEPGLRTRDEYGLTRAAGIWVVRVVADGEPVTSFVVDGTQRTYRTTPDGRIDFLGDTAGPEGTWPPAGATMVNVPGVEIAVVDLSNHLLGARAASLDSTTLPPDIAAKPIHLAETTTPRRTAAHLGRQRLRPPRERDGRQIPDDDLGRADRGAGVRW